MAGNETTGSILQAHQIQDHLHGKTFAIPSTSTGITLFAGSGAWNLGPSTQIIASGDVTAPFDIHYCVIDGMNVNGAYCLELWDGTVSSVTLVFARDTGQDKSFQLPAITPLISPNHQITGKLATSTGGSGDLCILKVMGHQY